MTKGEIEEKSLDTFAQLFKGRTDVYARRWERNRYSGYTPAYKFNWNEFLLHKKNGGTIHDFKNKKKLPLTKEVIKSHLLGEQVIGVYPLLKDNTCCFIAADFDRNEWKKESTQFIQTCLKYEIPAYLEISRSGNGAHAWIFFETPYPAKKAREIVLEIIRKSFNISDFQKDISFDRIFPNQDNQPKGGLGNLIALPLNGKSILKGTTFFVDTTTFKPYKDQWKFLSNIEKLKTEELDRIHSRLLSTQELLIPETSRPNYELEILLDEQLCINSIYIPRRLKLFLKEKLNFYNSEYIIKEKLGKSVYNVEKVFNLITQKGNYILIPRGFLDELEKFCEENHININIVDKRRKNIEIDFSDNIELLDYQANALDSCLKNDFGILVAPPGSGKTVMGLKLISERKQPALILVHRKQLLDQWVERIQSFLKIPKKDIGIISGSKKKIGKRITVGMIQTLARADNAYKYSNSFGTIVIDECHHIPAKSFRETVTKLKSYYLYGLTATPKRKYNDEKLIFVYIGKVLHTVNTTNYTQDSTNFKVIINETNLKLPFNPKIDDFHLLSKIICFDTDRNLQITNDIKEQIKKKSKILVLTDRKDHVNVLNQYLKDNCEAITLTGDDSSASKKSKIRQIEEGNFQVLISTGQLFGEGIDINNLDCLVLAFPLAFEGKLIQYIGRIQRTAGNKTILDYNDKKVEFLDKMFKKRYKYYRKLNTHL